MKKEDLITYLILWGVLVAICFYLIYTGAPFSIYAKETEVQEASQDAFFYDQIVAENEAKTKVKQAELEAIVLAEQEQIKIQEEEARQQKEQQQEKNETAQVLSSAAQAMSQSGNYLNDYFIVDPNTTLSLAEVPPSELLVMDMQMKGDAGEPQILVYHTHATEGYVDSNSADLSTTVVGVGDYLVDILTNQYGYQVIHVTDAYDLAEGTLNRSRAYNYARDGLEKVLADNPSIEVIIDLHRDGVPENRHLVTEIDGKQTAQIMFFNGLSKTNASGALDSLPNSYIKDNLAFSLQLEVLGNNYYKNFVRGVYVKGYRYNLHFRPKSLLLEVGAQTNTVEEAKNAMAPFANILDKLLKGT